MSEENESRSEERYLFDFLREESIRAAGVVAIKKREEAAEVSDDGGAES